MFHTCSMQKNDRTLVFTSWLNYFHRPKHHTSQYTICYSNQEVKTLLCLWQLLNHCSNDH